MAENAMWKKLMSPRISWKIELCIQKVAHSQKMKCNQIIILTQRLYLKSIKSKLESTAAWGIRYKVDGPGALWECVDVCVHLYECVSVWGQFWPPSEAPSLPHWWYSRSGWPVRLAMVGWLLLSNGKKRMKCYSIFSLFFVSPFVSG